MDFPREIIEEIFMRLPVKQLTRFKCVSKNWNDFISNSYFRKRYQSQEQSKCSASTGFICFDHQKYKPRERYNVMFGDPGDINFLYTSENYVEKEELKSLNNLKEFGYIVAASKSLLLQCYNPEYLCVYDLVFKKVVNLPRNPGVGDHVSFGFKCEEQQDHNRVCYTVVCVDIPHRTMYTASSIFNVKIYSSETGYWRDSIMKAKQSSTLFRVHTKYVAKVIGGVFHWHDPCVYRIIAYDSEDPEGHVVLIETPPTKCDHTYERERLRELEGRKDGSLQFISIDNIDMIIRVWIMKSTTSTGQSYMDEEIVDVSRWSLTCRVNLCDIGIGVDNLWGFGNFISVDPGDADVIYWRSRGEIYAYNYRKQTVVPFSQKLSPKASIFVHFEWPVWPFL